MEFNHHQPHYYHCLCLYWCMKQTYKYMVDFFLIVIVAMNSQTGSGGFTLVIVYYLYNNSSPSFRRE